MTSSNGHAAADDNGTVDKDVTAPTQAVKVAVHIRPLIANERLQGCKDCVTIIRGQPQVQIGNCSFTFDHVYGSTATPPGRIFEECVTPLVDGLFHGYNATVLAYGQTGSGKTYTMGTGFTTGSSTDGVIPQVMELIYKKMESSSKKVEYQVRVSFIEILNEEVYDLLDSSAPTTTRPDMYVGVHARPTTPSKNSLQIRETTGGEITLSGVTEIEVNSLHQMATLLEQGSLSRATASTNMNSTSSRSHAILTITLHQHRKLDVLAASNGTASTLDSFHDDYLCAKLHLVDLAGSERVKRTGADGVRFKEGVHINKGLLALGNVISALGDEKKRKDGGHVPYRDSKLTRLLQDSLGGNSRTVMIACISPADSNAEESLNTLKYANRARNIQNKPIVNRDPMLAEMQRMRQQLELLQAELLCFRAGGGAMEDTHTLKQKIAWLEANNSGLRQELQQARDGLQFCAQRVLDALIERDNLRHKIDLLRSGKTWEEVNGVGEYQPCRLNDSVELLHAYTTKIQELESSIHHIENVKSQTLAPISPSPFIRCVNGSIVNTGDCLELHEVHRMMSSTPEEDETAAKELEHTRLQVSMDKELQELNERLEQKEAEMTMIVKLDSEGLKEQFEKKLMELEEEKKTLQMERDVLLLEIENLSCVSDEQTQKMQEDYAEKLKSLESQLAELKQKQDNQAQFLKQRLHNDDAENHLQEEIQRIKQQKVQLQQRIKQESEYFRYWKAAREKELLQLKKEGRKNEHEMLKLQALNQRQKMVLQRKTEEAALATRRLKDILEARKSSTRENGSTGPNAANGSPKHMNQKLLQQFIDQELEIAVHIHEVRSNYEKQAELRASLARELGKLRQEEDVQLDLKETNGNVDCTPASTNCVTNPDARRARAELLKTMLDTSSNALVAMASELSEAEERERVCTGPGRWQQLRTMGDAKSLLHYVFSIAVDSRCHLWDSNRENKDLKENIGKLKELLKQSEAHRREAHRQHHLTEHAIAKAIKTSTQVNDVGLEMSRSGGMEEVSMSLLHSRGLDPQELYPAYSQSDAFSISSHGSQYGFKKPIPRGARVKQNHPQVGKLLRWKRSHERWLLQFKWRWQKPWRLSEWIRHGDESLTRPRPLRLSNAAEFR